MHEKHFQVTGRWRGPVGISITTASEAAVAHDSSMAGAGERNAGEFFSRGGGLTGKAIASFIRNGATLWRV